MDQLGQATNAGTVGWAYYVRAADEALARRAARDAARADGHPNPNGTILWVERLKAGLYEVVINEEKL